VRSKFAWNVQPPSEVSVGSSGEYVRSGRCAKCALARCTRSIAFAVPLTIEPPAAARNSYWPPAKRSVVLPANATASRVCRSASGSPGAKSRCTTLASSPAVEASEPNSCSTRPSA
jgi:hypothetical protein